MKVIILEKVCKLTNRYHHDGGLVVIAKNLERAKEMFKRKEEENAWRNHDEYDKYWVQPTEEEWGKAIVYDLKVDNVEETFFIFPDAGCC